MLPGFAEVLFKQNGLEDKQLITECITKDRKAIEAFYRRHYAFLYRVCFLYLRNEDDTKDAVSQVFMKVFDNLHTLESGEGGLMPWMRRIAVNLSIDLIRSRKRNAWSDIEDEKLSLPEVSVNFDGKLQLERVIRFIETMSSPMKEVIKLFAIEGYSHKEISVVVNITELYSRNLLAQARKQLNMNFREEEIR